MKISTQPYKGSRDFYPEQLQVRSYIFEAFRIVCKRYGYQEYDGPFIESLDLYKAKSGQEIVEEEIYNFIDKGNREVAIRPEMTPTLARMVAAKSKELIKPIRWFSIPNVWRYEKPQKGRLREHYQLNVDIYGVKNIQADAEIISLLVDIFKYFGATNKMFKVKINNRKLINELFDNLKIDKKNYLIIYKILDKKLKVSNEEFLELLKSNANLNIKQVDLLCHYLNNPQEIFEFLGDKSNSVREVKMFFELIENFGIKDYVEFDPTIIRGLDYYTSLVFEVFDLNNKNKRALSGGGRYDDLLSMFVNQSEPAVGFGLGDVTIIDFLNDWKLIPNFKNKIDYFITVWPFDKSVSYICASFKIANLLRSKNYTTITWTDSNTKIDKQIKHAVKLNADKLIIIGPNELSNNQLVIKNIQNKGQITLLLEEFYKNL